MVMINWVAIHPLQNLNHSWLPIYIYAYEVIEYYGIDDNWVLLYPGLAAWNVMCTIALEKQMSNERPSQCPLRNAITLNTIIKALFVYYDVIELYQSVIQNRLLISTFLNT